MVTHTAPVELVEVRASDDVALSGALAAPERSGPAPRFDAALLMHGAAATFSGPFYRNFSAALNARGVATLRANNRGHDIINRGDGRGRLLGVALENVADCVLDWRAWLDFLAQCGYGRILLFGHSLGAVKSAFYLGTESDPRVTGCVLASPPRFDTERMLASSRGGEFAATIAAAQALVDDGRPDDLLATTFPLRAVAGAAAYLAKYASGTRFDVFTYVARIPCPVLALTGSEELGEPTFSDHPDAYAAARALKPDVDFVVVPDGDHHYSRAQTFAVERLLAWIDGGGQETGSPSSRRAETG
jgi:dipeptidyl aminopeptidase/acylaminoacyl peptidase